MTGRNKEELNGVTLLGSQKNKYPSDYAPEMLETFPNKHPDNDYFVKFNCPEFTSLCPMTGQPDFAMCPASAWQRASRSSCICSASATTAISMRTA